MDLRFVSSLLAVIDEGSLAAAARRDGVTAAAVAQRVAALEAQLKVPLLLRAGRVMQPTPECRSILPQLRQLLRDAAALKSTLQAEVMQGPLRLGLISTAIGDHAASLLKGLQQAAPDVKLQLIPGSSAALHGELTAERLDAALISKPPFALPKSLTFLPLQQQEIGWLSPPMERSGDLPLVLYSREAWGGETCWQALPSDHAADNILAEMDALETIAQLVSDGLGRSVLPRWPGLERYAPQARFHPIPGAFREIGLLIWSRDLRSPMVRLLEAILTGAEPDQRGR